MATFRHEAMIAAAGKWAEVDERVRLLLLKGSLTLGEADKRSDVDLVIVTSRGRLEDLWADRRAVAERLDRCLAASTPPCMTARSRSILLPGG